MFCNFTEVNYNFLQCASLCINDFYFAEKVLRVTEMQIVFGIYLGMDTNLNKMLFIVKVLGFCNPPGSF